MKHGWLRYKMEDLYHLVLERNARETTPFVAVHEANATLLNQIEALQTRCEELERDLVVQQERLDGTGSSGGRGASAALKNETRLREKLERLQEELSDKMKQQAEQQDDALKVAKELSEVKDLNVAQESTISNLTEENKRKERTIEHLTTELTDSKQRTKLAEQQYVGLKDTIRVLQEENDQVQKENRELESRLISEKETMSSEMNVLTEMVDRLKKEVDMLRTLKEQDEKRKSWFGLAASGKEKKPEVTQSSTRKFGNISVVAPSSPKFIVSAHTSQASCLR